MVRAFHAAILAICLLGAALAGCAAGPIVDELPGEIGLPKGAPARPVAPYQYPAVHDMPPARATTPMTDEEQLRLENELSAVRDRQEAQEGKAGQKDKKTQDSPGGKAKTASPPATKKTAPVTEKQPSTLPNNAILVPPAGAKTNP
jgi:hypothetical protein